MINASFELDIQVMLQQDANRLVECRMKLWQNDQTVKTNANEINNNQRCNNKVSITRIKVQERSRQKNFRVVRQPPYINDLEDLLQDFKSITRFQPKLRMTRHVNTLLLELGLSLLSPKSTTPNLHTKDLDFLLYTKRKHKIKKKFLFSKQE